MTELEIPTEADEQRAKELVREFVEVGDTVEVRLDEIAEVDDPHVRGEVTGVEPGYLELDGQDLAEGSVRYDEIRLVSQIERR